MYTCPVCGWEGLKKDPEYLPLEFCLCCGYEFGFDDYWNGFSYERYRASWITRGMPWLDPVLKPDGWDSQQQLRQVAGIKREITFSGTSVFKHPVGDAPAFRAVAFTSEQHGCIVGAEGIILTTHTGGRFWQAQQVPSMHNLFTVAFCTPTTVLTGGFSYDSRLFRSTDAGMSWEPVAPEIIGFPISIMCLSHTRGIVAGGRGMLLKTDDAGLTWQELRSETQRWLGALAFWTPQYGIAAGSSGTLLETDDGGVTWHPVPNDIVSDFNAVVAVGSAQLYALLDENWPGSEEYLARSADGGAHWERIERFTDQRLTDLAFPTPSIGYAVGEGGTLARSDDAGSTWRLIPIETQASLRAVTFPTPEVGYAVGDDATVLKTTDAGASWQRLPVNVQELLPG